MRHISHLILLSAALLYSMSPCSALDATRPAASFLFPTSGLQVSNSLITVRGKAIDNTVISNVLLSINRGAWFPADTTNSWTNWFAEFSLIPGSNVVSACAVDAVGNRSTTNTVKIFYYLPAILTVSSNGAGSISPNYNNATLAIGRTYSMTASSSIKGFGLKRWTDGNNTVVGTNATLRFIMASNLSLTANFGDILKPVIRVTGAATNSNGDPNSLVLRGTTTDNVRVAAVFYRLNDLAPRLITQTTNHWTNWNLTLEGLMPGQNAFQVYAIDTSSNVSSTYPVNILNNTAPISLAGKTAKVVPDIGSDYIMSLGVGSYSLKPEDVNSVFAVGSYTYQPHGGFASLKLNQIAPPTSAATSFRTFNLTFLTPTNASYRSIEIFSTNFITISTNTTPPTTNSVPTNLPVQVTGNIYFTPSPRLAPLSAMKQIVYSFDGDGSNVHAIFFQTDKYLKFHLGGPETNSGQYLYKAYSPLGALFKLTASNRVEYLVTHHSASNHGIYYHETRNTAGIVTDSGRGNFIVSSPSSGSNAPTSLVNRKTQVRSGGDTFELQFSDNTYSQESATTNFDNAIGSYSFSLITGDIGQLEMISEGPPHLTGITNAARLIFLSKNAGMFTNEDGTFSSFVIESAQDVVPTSVTNTTIRVGSDGSLISDDIQLGSDGTFRLNDKTAGTFDFTPYSPGTALLRLQVNTNYTSGTDWIQLNFKSTEAGTNYGRAFIHVYDTTNSLIDSFGGDFRHFPSPPEVNP